MGKLRPGGFWELDCPAPGLQSLGLLTPYPLSVSVKLLLLGCCGCWRGAGAKRFPRCGTRTHSLAPSLAFYHGSTREQVSGEKKRKKNRTNKQTKKKKKIQAFILKSTTPVSGQPEPSVQAHVQSSGDWMPAVHRPCSSSLGLRTAALTIVSSRTTHTSPFSSTHTHTHKLTHAWRKYHFCSKR